MFERLHHMQATVKTSTHNPVPSSTHLVPARLTKAPFLYFIGVSVRQTFAAVETKKTRGNARSGRCQADDGSGHVTVHVLWRD